MRTDGGSEKRIALVIGNGGYRYAPQLVNPPKDARAICRTLKRLGFAIVPGFDLGRDTMEDTLEHFYNNIETADVAMFYFAGHGLQVDGENYLIPVDSELRYEYHLETRTFKLNKILKSMVTRADNNLLFIDACRENPFARSLAAGMSSTRGKVIPRAGLADIQASKGSFVAYATAPDNTADDGVGNDNSPFTTALLKYIAQPGLSVSDMMINVRNEVRKNTNGRQIPWEQSSLERRFCFNATGQESSADMDATTIRDVRNDDSITQIDNSNRPAIGSKTDSVSASPEIPSTRGGDGILRRFDKSVLALITAVGILLAAATTAVTNFKGLHDAFCSVVDVCKPPMRKEFEPKEVVAAEAVGNDDSSLKALPRDEANRKAGVIEAEAHAYAAVKDDLAGLTAFLAKPCEACLVRAAAEFQLKKLMDELAREIEAVKAAGYDESRLKALARDATTAAARDKANRKLGVIATEQQRFDVSQDNQAALEALAINCVACLVRQKALNRIDILTAVQASKSANSYVLLAVLDKYNNVRKRYFSIAGKPNSNFPAPNDVLISEPRDDISVMIRAVPYHWDHENNAASEGIPTDVSIIKGGHIQVRGNAYVSIDKKNGEQYIIVPVYSPLIKKKIFDPIIPKANIYGYAFYGLIDDKTNRVEKPFFKIFMPKEREAALYPAVGDELEALRPVKVRQGPFTWDNDKNDYFQPPSVGEELKPGNIVRVVGDVILAMGGRSIWIPIALSK
jgi:hypothetical protein